MARRETAVEVTPGQPGTLEIRLDLPTARAELVIPATVSVALDAGPRVEHRLWIFPEDPFVGRRALMEKMNISVFDPEGKTVRRLEEHRVPGARGARRGEPGSGERRSGTDRRGSLVS